MPLTPGSTFERYEIQSLIGRGGMGEVYRAIDTRLHRPVALKVLRTDKDASATVTEAGGVQRLLREARAAAALNHANSVAIYELGEAEGIAYIAMELISGVTLRRYLGEGNVSVDTKLSWLVDAARALWAAHKAGLVHRDVKPGNIMVSEEGVVKVLDFGLAKPVTVTSTDPATFQTLMGQVLGTPRYMAPEQLEGAPADAKADQFAFGLTAYELLSGVYPGGPLAGAVQPLDTLVNGVSSELARAVARMMARNPNERFTTMEGAAHALRVAVHAPASPLRRAAPAKAPRTSDAPTQGVPIQAAARVADPASRVNAVMAKGATLPLAIPLPMAMGAGAARAPAPSFNRTMPLARPITSPHAIPPPAPSSGSLPSASAADTGSSPRLLISSSGLTPAPSGVYASKNHAAAQRSKTGGLSVLTLVLIALAAASIGGGVAWFLH